jgi:hypothetical protein
MRWRRIGVLVAVLAGCGEAQDLPEMYVSVDVDWDYAPPTREALGYTFTVTFRQRPSGSLCEVLPASIRFSIDGQEVGSPIRDPDSGCVTLDAIVGPTLDNHDTMAVAYEKEGRQVATAVFEDLTPGLSAALIVPANGQARAGDEILIVPPPEIPTSDPNFLVFYPLDDAAATTVPVQGVRASEPATRSAVGIHAKVPAVTGRIALAIETFGFEEATYVSCDGFASCFAGSARVVGPIALTVQP